MSDHDDPAHHGSSRSLREYLLAVPHRGSTTELVTDTLREAILDGGLVPGDRLREDELAQDLGVSRTPVREALRRLADERLTVHRVHAGSVVASMTIDDILAVYLVRENLEGLAAHLTAMRQPPGLLDDLTQVHKEMVDRLPHADTAELVTLNLRFHRIVREGSGNSYLERFLTQVEHAVRRFGRSTYEQPGRAAAVVAEHAAIVSAIASGDPELAAEKSRAHMRAAREMRIQTLIAR